MKQNHALNVSRHIAPVHKHLMASVQIRTTPNVEGIGISTITSPFAVAENLLNESVVKEASNKIAAFLPVRMIGKECGNFNSVVFQGIAGAKQFVLFIIVVVEIHIPCVISVAST